MSDKVFYVGQEGVTVRGGPIEQLPVRILCNDINNSKPIVFAVRYPNGKESVFVCRENGRYLDGDQEHHFDLIPPPPPKQYVWAIVYRNSEGVLYANNLYDYPLTKDQCRSNAVGCIRVELAERWDG